MDFVNETPLQSSWTLGFQPDGREVLIIVAKGTFTLPDREVEAPLADEQAPLTDSDVFAGAPGFSAPLHESDFAHRKPRCDVLLNGSAHAQGGRPVSHLPVMLALGKMKKSFMVTGRRAWQSTLLGGVRAGAPEPFTSMPFSYDRAFGGAQFLANPVGKGHHSRGEEFDQRPMPSTEELDNPVSQPWGSYAPMALGAVGRNWHPRFTYAGTYDQAWMDKRMPFLPEDFDDRYFQAAPADQQVPYPQGDELVVLVNLSPKSPLRFRLPRLSVPVALIPHRGTPLQLPATLDTVLLEPDLGRLSLTWRIAWPLRRNAFEMRQVVVGGKTRGWFRAQEVGKPYYPNMEALVRERSHLRRKE